LVLFLHIRTRAEHLIPKRRNHYHGKENLEESKEAGSNEAPDDRWRRPGISKRFVSAPQVRLFIRKHARQQLPRTRRAAAERLAAFFIGPSFSFTIRRAHLHFCLHAGRFFARHRIHFCSNFLLLPRDVELFNAIARN
jgi:hypothetical protein